MRTRFTLTDRGFSAALERQAHLVPIYVGDAIYAEAELIMTDSKDNYVPVDIGTLKASGYVNEPEEVGHKVSVELGYGGEADDYAWVQHERLDFHHEVGEAKYLETPFNEAVNGLEGRLAERVKRRL